MDLSFDVDAFSGHVPLFPLPGTVLLPGALLPLHLFEPRYRAMVVHALKGERLIAMALLRPGYEADYEGNPAIEEHVCIGRILLEEPLEDGRWNILLVGLRRARVLEEDRSRPFRVARVEVLEDAQLDDEVPEAQALRALLEQVPRELVRDESRRELVVHLLGRSEAPGDPVGLGTLLDLRRRPPAPRRAGPPAAPRGPRPRRARALPAPARRGAAEGARGAAPRRELAAGLLAELTTA